MMRNERLFLFAMAIAAAAIVMSESRAPRAESTKSAVEKIERMNDQSVRLVDHAPATDWVRMGNPDRPEDMWLISYDGRTRTTRWTLEILTAESVKGEVTRAGQQFRQARAPQEFAATPGDYARSGFDLGHQAAAANHATSPEALQATFTTANATPQTPSLNRGRWRELEEHVRSLAEAKDVLRVYVITAPLWKPAGRLPDGTAWLTVQMIGRTGVWIPTHCGKAVLIERVPSIELRAWIVPNDDQPPSLDECRVSTDDFERVAGLDLWARMPDDVENALEAVR